MLVVPVMQTIIFGYAIDTQIENIPTVVFNMDGRAQSRQLVDSFVNTRRFKLVGEVRNEEEFMHAITAGDAKVGIKIPPNYSDRMIRGEQVQVQVLIDGSDSQVATTALNTSQLLGINTSIALARQKAEAIQVAPARDATGRGDLPIEFRPRLLYNPDLKSAYFFVPGLVGIILQLVTLFLTSFAIVRERELGTLEQLFVTPVGRTGLLLGKLVPYAAVGFVETLIVLCVMIYVFGVPIRGDIRLLLSLCHALHGVLARSGLAGLDHRQDSGRGRAVRLRDHVAFGTAIGLCVSAERNAAADLHYHLRDSRDLLYRDLAWHCVARSNLRRSDADGRVGS